MHEALRAYGGSYRGPDHPRRNACLFSETGDGGLLLAVCTGVDPDADDGGGSRLAVLAIEAQAAKGPGSPQERVVSCVEAADRILRENRGEGGKTLQWDVMVAWLVDGFVHAAWAGAPQAFLVRDNAVAQRAGGSGSAYPPAGGEERPSSIGALTDPWPLTAGDYLAICCPSTCKVVDEAEIVSHLGADAPEKCVDMLLRLIGSRKPPTQATLAVASFRDPQIDTLVNEIPEEVRSQIRRETVDGGDSEEEATDPGVSAPPGVVREAVAVPAAPEAEGASQGTARGGAPPTPAHTGAKATGGSRTAFALIAILGGALAVIAALAYLLAT